MAFVTRSQRCPSFIPTNNSLGPGEYDTVLSTNRKLPSISYRESGPSRIPIKDMPGPGTYNQEYNSPNRSKPSASFKSSTIRFQGRIPRLPGPGAYEIVKEKCLTEKKIEPRCKMIEQLIYAGLYQSVNSIPYEKKYNNSVGPGQYDHKSSFDLSNQAGCVLWSKQSSKAQIVQEPTLGPGQYELAPNKIYKKQHKQTQQASSMCRAYLKKGISNKVYYSFDMDRQDSESEYEFIEDSTPGPGYYATQLQSTAASDKSNGLMRYPFNNKAPRFSPHRVSAIPGPGQYNPKLESKIMTMKFNKAESDNNVSTQTPAPNQYTVHTTLVDKVAQQLARSSMGHFGTKQPRFPKVGNANPGPGDYSVDRGRQQQVGQNSSFISTSNRDTDTGDRRSPPPGSYDIDADSMINRISRRREIENELGVKHPPFGSTSKRLEQQIIPEESDQEYIEKKPSVLFKKKPGKKIPFVSKVPRFKIDDDEQVGPGEYNINQDQNWIKKSYNIIFTN